MASEKRPSSLYMDLKELRNRFDEVDIEGNGYIDYEGLKRMISHMEGFNSSALQELMNTLDRNGDGKVTFEDFQIVFTLERDAVKAEQKQNSESFDSSSSTHNSSSAYVTALHSQSSRGDNSSHFSPERPPLPTGYHSSYRKPFSSLNQVLDSPDLSTHVRRLQKSMSDHPDTSQRLSLNSEQGDLVLEDTGTVGTTLPSSGPIPPSPNALLGLGLIQKELHSMCKNGIVERKNISQLCKRLGVDAKDEEEFLGLWDELQTVSNDKITVEAMYQLIKQKETIAMVTSTPANQTTHPARLAWQKNIDISMESFDDHSQNDSLDIEEDADEEEETSDEERDEVDWVDGRNYPFNEMPHIHSLRPSSAKEGSRLSKGHSDSSLRQTAMMQKFYTEYQLLRENLDQVTQERDSLKQSLSRVEHEKKQLIQEGEESVVNIQKQKEAAIRKLESEFSSKHRHLEASLSIDHQTQQDTLGMEIMELKEKIKSLKLEDEALKEDLKYYQSDNEKLVDSIDKLRNEIVQKENKINLLQEKLGIPLESISESDLELHISRIHELESSLQDYIDINENLQKQNTDLQDKVDELTAQCEQINQKYTEEKRKRQRRASDVSQPPQISNPHRKSSRHSRSSRSGRHLPKLLASIPDYKASDSENQEMADGQTDSHSTEPWMTSDEESHDASIEADDIAAKSSTSLLEEIRVTDEKQALLTRISELQNLHSLLEKNCEDLRSQIDSLEGNNVILRTRLEQELRQKNFQKSSLDKRLKKINSSRNELAAAQKAVTDKTMTSEELLAQFLQSVDNDMQQLVANDTTDEVELFQQLTEEISTLKTQAHEREVTIEEQNKEILKLQEYTMELKDTNGKLQQIAEQQDAHIAIIANEKVALEKQCHHLKTKAETQERELRRTRTESRLAIHDLAKKEEEFVTQQEKVMKLERELFWLHNTKDQQTDNIAQLERHLDEKESEMRLLAEENAEIQTKLEALQFQSDAATAGLSGEKEDGGLLAPGVTSPRLDQSFSSSTGQNEILHQMKSELKQLQMVLIEKEGNEGSELELSFVHELLQINTSLEENLIQQHQKYDSLVSCKDERIKELECLLDATDGELAANSSAAKVEMESLQECIDTLKSKELEREEILCKLELELNKQKQDREFHSNIVHKQKGEIEKLNHYLGKARSKQIHSDTEKEKMGKCIEQQRQEILNIRMQYESKSVPELATAEEMKDKAELITANESLQTAEQLISDMREQLLRLYQHVIQPSDSKASDLLEYSELIVHLRDNFDSLNEELLNLKEAQEDLHESLMSHSHEYDSLYSEHEEEVKAIEQQKESLLLQMSLMEKQFKDELTAQLNTFELKAEEERKSLRLTLGRIKKENQLLEVSLKETVEGRDALEAALENANSRIDELNDCKAQLIKLIQTISVQALSSLTSIV